MGLVPCRECGYQISSDAKACPQCGAEPNKPTSRIKLALIGLAIAAVGIMLSRPSGEFKSASIAPEFPRVEISPDARSQIRKDAKDADSLKFRNEFTANAGISCGEVNGKNNFGAYSGFKRFIANGTTVLLDDESTNDFDKAWREFCVPKKST